MVYSNRTKLETVAHIVPCNETVFSVYLMVQSVQNLAVVSIFIMVFKGGGGGGGDCESK